MIQNSFKTIEVSPERAEYYARAVQRAIVLLGTMGLSSAELLYAAELSELLASLRRIAGLFEADDPFSAPEGDGSALSVLLGRFVSTNALILGFMQKVAWEPTERQRFQRTKEALLADWREYEEASEQ
jgi:hypothetical protein